MVLESSGALATSNDLNDGQRLLSNKVLSFPKEQKHVTTDDECASKSTSCCQFRGFSKTPQSFRYDPAVATPSVYGPIGYALRETKNMEMNHTI
jgi:hypothetical protein